MNNQNQIEKIINDPKVRKKVTWESHKWFFAVYFGEEYLTYPSAPFHEELFALTEDELTKLMVICAFRGSGKTTIMSQSYPIWAILGKLQKKHVLILTQTMGQAKQHLKNIKDLLEKNELLAQDLGPFKEENEEWRSFALVLPRYNARISAASSEQSIRGIMHGPYRPQLIILDDVEDLNSVRTQEGRDKTFEWVTGDVMPLGDRDTKVVIIGNMLHQDSLMMRYKEKIEAGEVDGIFKSYPAVDQQGQIAWPGKYPTLADLEKEKRKTGSEIAFRREFMLQILPEEDQIVRQEWLKYYEELPKTDDSKLPFRYYSIAVDPAISTKSTADYTAIIPAAIYGYGEKLRIFILPEIINRKMDFPTTLRTIKETSQKLGKGRKVRILIEDVGFQKGFIQELQREHYPAFGVPVYSNDKRARLILTTPAIKNGAVCFPKIGAEILKSQLLGFETEKHDDLVDALTISIQDALANSKRRASPEVFLVG